MMLCATGAKPAMTVSARAWGRWRRRATSEPRVADQLRIGVMQLRVHHRPALSAGAHSSVVPLIAQASPLLDIHGSSRREIDRAGQDVSDKGIRVCEELDLDTIDLWPPEDEVGKRFEDGAASRRPLAEPER